MWLQNKQLNCPLKNSFHHFTACPPCQRVPRCIQMCCLTLVSLAPPRPRYWPPPLCAPGLRRSGPGLWRHGRHLHNMRHRQRAERRLRSSDVLCVGIMDKYQWTIREMARIFYSLVIIYCNYSWICNYYAQIDEEDNTRVTTVLYICKKICIIVSWLHNKQGKGFEMQYRWVESNCQATGTGTWHLALGTWHLALGTWHLALGTWDLGPGTWDLEPGT